jgi:hypothetical protein
VMVIEIRSQGQKNRQRRRSRRRGWETKGERILHNVRNPHAERGTPNAFPLSP